MYQSSSANAEMVYEGVSGVNNKHGGDQCGRRKYDNF